MQQKQNCGHPLRRKGSISRVSKVTCGLLFCLTTGVFAAGENVELLTSDRIENAVPDQVGKTVTIMVQDEMGPVAGANVVVKGTTNGNISDMDGKVVLQNVPNNSTLVISFIGYTTQEVKVGNQATIHVKLVEDAKALEEVVVIGYGSLDKKQVTSAITSLKADDLMVGVSGADISGVLARQDRRFGDEQLGKCQFRYDIPASRYDFHQFRKSSSYRDRWFSWWRYPFVDAG